jgi:hypothetical protein
MLTKTHNYLLNIILNIFIIFISFQANAINCHINQENQNHYYTNVNNIPHEVYYVLSEIQNAKANNYSFVQAWTRSGTDYVSYNGGIHYYSTKPWHNREGRLPVLNNYQSWLHGSQIQREFYIEHDIIPYYQGINRGSHRIIYNTLSGESFYTADHYNTFVRIQNNWTNYNYINNAP